VASDKMVSATFEEFYERSRNVLVGELLVPSHRLLCDERHQTIHAASSRGIL
jgi:hypothetical protein